MLVKSKARFLGDAGRIGVDSAEKLLDFLCNLFLARRGTLTWLDVMLHFRLHSRLPQKTQPRHPSASPNPHVFTWTLTRRKGFAFEGKAQNTQTILPGKWHFGAR